MNFVRLPIDRKRPATPTRSEMSRQSSLLSRLGRLRDLTGILDRPKGVKSRLGLSRSGLPEWKTIELQEDVLSDDVPALSDQPRSGVDSVDKGPQCPLAVIRLEELVISLSETSQESPPDPDHEVECAVLKAAKEGWWDEINQVYNRPDQQERVLQAQNKFGWDPLHFAVYYGHLNIVKQLVNVCKHSPEQKTKDGRTPLMLAAGAGHLPVARHLVETYHCDVNEEDGKSATAVFYAAVRGHLPVVKVLLAHGADVFHKAQDSLTALHLAALGGSLECVKYLLPLFGDRKFEVDEKRRSCLHFAVWGGSLPVMRYLVDQCGFELSLRTIEGGLDCFLVACLAGHEKIVCELLTKDKVDQNVVDKEGRGAIHLACGCNHVQLVETLVGEFGMSPDNRDNDGRTPLMLAAQFGHLPVARLLVETYHCDVNKEDSGSVTPVLLAARKGHLPVLKILLAHGADVFHKLQGSATALHFAALCGSVECVKYLLPLFGDRKFEVDENGGTCLHYAVAGGSLPVMRYLVDQCGFDLSLRTTADDLDCFLFACLKGHQGIVRELLAKDRVDKNVVAKDGWGAIHLACRNDHVQVVETLVGEFGIAPDTRDNNGRTPLMLAAQFGHLSVARLLVETYHCGVNEEDGESLTPVLFAARNGHLPVLKMLLSHGADVFHKTKVSLTALHLSALGGSLECVKYLLPLFEDKKFEVDEQGATCLHWAVAGGSLPVMRYLVDQCGFDLSLQTGDGQDCFLLVCARGHQEIVRELLTKDKVDQNVVKEGGHGAVHLACANGHIQLVQTLVGEFGMSPDVRDNGGRTPLMMAAGAGHLPVARLLVETYHCDVNEEDGESVTPVLYAARNRHLPVLNMLLSHGADLFHKTKGSVTALHLAAYGGSLECVKYLLPLFGDRKVEVDEKGWTCLHYAVEGGSLPVMRYLVDQCGFDLSLRTADGQDCFLLTCVLGRQEIVRELLTKDKVDQNVVDIGGRGAVHLACEGGHIQLVETLVGEFGMPPDTRDNTGKTPIDLAPEEALADFFSALHLDEDRSAPQWDSQPHVESVLEETCWIPSGMESLWVTPFGGVFPLVIKEFEEEEERYKTVTQLLVPQGAVRAEGEGLMEVRYAVIADGPFKTPKGYNLCSMAVYIHYNPALATKPFLLLLPHWSGAPDHPVFVTSPHTLPEGEQYYPFRLLEGGEFGEGYGIVEVDGHCSLFAQAYRLEDNSRYYASLWEREEEQNRHSRVAVTFADAVWIQILSRYWKKWKKHHNVQFEFDDDCIEGNLDVERGRSWGASIVGPTRVSAKEVQFKTVYSPRTLKEAVMEEVYPPSMTVKVVHSEMPRHLRCPRLIHLHVSRTKSGQLTFPVEVSEEKELCAGEKEVVQSPESVMSAREPVLSQPVHSCVRYAVLFRKHISRQCAGKGKAVLECLELTREQIQSCYRSNPLNEEEAVQDGLHQWKETHGDRCTWEVLLKAMTDAGITQQHCRELVKELHQWMQDNI